ncbi:MAG: hypothetical protein ACLSD6_00975 [Clostridium sp.]
MLRGVKQWAFEKQIPAWISMEEKMACGIGACLAWYVSQGNRLTFKSEK